MNKHLYRPMRVGKDKLMWEGTPFSSTNPQAKFVFSGGGDERRIYAPSDGRLTLGEDEQSITIELGFGFIKFIQQKLGLLEDGVPKTVTMSPIEDATSGIALAGDNPIGKLKGDSLQISFSDYDGYFYDPMFIFLLCHKFNIWEAAGNVDNPFVMESYPIEKLKIARRVSDLTQPYLVICNLDSDTTPYPLEIHNPKPIDVQKEGNSGLPPAKFSFLSTDRIQLGVANLTNTQEAIINIWHKAEGFKPRKKKRHRLSIAYLETWDFVPKTIFLKPHSNRQKSREPSEPLKYEIKVKIREVGKDTTLSQFDTKIEQDFLDIIRQEYVSFDLGIIKREEILSNVVPEFLPDFARNFSPKQMQFSNYNEPCKEDNERCGFLYRRDEQYIVAEFIRRALASRLITMRENGALPYWAKSYDLNVNSGWRNPKRNKAVGSIINDSNHTRGRALDLVLKGNGGIRNNKLLHMAMFEVGYDFLETMLEINPDTGANPSEAYTIIEVLLEKGAAALWNYKAIKQKNGTIIIDKREGSYFRQVVGQDPVSDDDENIALAAEKASHVHIGWRNDPPLQLPELVSYDGLPATPEAPIKHMIFFGQETASDNPNYLPLERYARTMRDFLQRTDPGTEIEMKEVSTPLDFLENLNAYVFRKAIKHRLGYLICFFRPTNGGFQLRYPRLDSSSAEAQEIHSIMKLYYKPPQSNPFDSLEPSEIGQDWLQIGEDPISQVHPNEIRLADFKYMDTTTETNLRMTLKEILERDKDPAKDKLNPDVGKGIYFIGCQSAISNATSTKPKKSDFAEAFAKIVEKRVHSTVYPSTVTVSVGIKPGSTTWEKIESGTDLNDFEIVLPFPKAFADKLIRDQTKQEDTTPAALREELDLLKLYHDKGLKSFLVKHPPPERKRKRTWHIYSPNEN